MRVYPSHSPTSPPFLLDKKNTAVPAHHTAPHHKHAPSVGGTTHNEEPLVDLAKLKAKMERALTTLQREFSGVRGGRPDPGMFDHLHVQAYGKSTPLSEVAQVGKEGEREEGREGRLQMVTKRKEYAQTRTFPPPLTKYSSALPSCLFPLLSFL